MAETAVSAINKDHTANKVGKLFCLIASRERFALLLLLALFVGDLADGFGLSLARHVLNGNSLHFGKIHNKLAGKFLSCPWRPCTTCAITTVTTIA